MNSTGPSRDAAGHGAAASHAASGDDAGKVITPLVIGLLVAASWALRPAPRTLKPLFGEVTPKASLHEKAALA